MRYFGKIVKQTLLVGAPLLVSVLWLASGREVFTKSRRLVEIEVRDDLFGDMITETQMVRGPVLGYFVGLDLVAVTASVSLTVGGIMLWSGRRKRTRTKLKGERDDQ